MLYVPLHARLPVLDDFLAITHVRNRGMAFGLFSRIEADWLRWLLVLVAVVAVAIIWSHARRETGRLRVVLAFGAILGGALGNLIDRLRHGYVVDFVLAHWGRAEWPAFNVADSAITMGGIVLFLALARDHAEPAAAAPDRAGAEPPAGVDDVPHEHV